MKPGTAIAKALKTIGVTPQRVTAAGQSIGLLGEDADCGCDQRAAAIDELAAKASRVVRKIPDGIRRIIPRSR